MFGKRFELNEQTIPMIEEIGRHMPGDSSSIRPKEPAIFSMSIRR